MNQVEKPIDAVRMMRSIRDRISKEMRGMTFEEQQEYIYARLPAEAVAYFAADTEDSNKNAQASRSSDDLTAGF